MSKLFPEVHAPELEDIGKTPEYERIPDWHSVVTIKFGELIELGFVKWYTVANNNKKVINEDWAWDYWNVDQYYRLCDKINARFYWDEISIVPPGIWKQQIIRKLNEIMPKYKPLYEAVARGFDPWQDGNGYGKSRNIHSEFPETLLSGNADYVSHGDDREYEDVHEGGVAAMTDEYVKLYQDIDCYILDELECLFSSLYTVNMNAF